MTNELRDAIDMMLAAASQANLTLNRVSDDERARASDARQARWDAVALTAMMQAQIKTLHVALSGPKPWQRLSEIYPSLTETAEDQALAEKIDSSIVIDKIINLYKDYVHEWEKVVSEIDKKDGPSTISTPSLPTRSNLKERTIPLWN